MTTSNQRHVVHHPNGGWAVAKPHAERVSSRHQTQAQARTRAKEILSHGGGGEAVSDQEIIDAIKLLASTEGIFTETAGGVTVAAAKKLIENGVIRKNESCVICITGNGLKTQEAVTDHIGKPYRIKPTIDSFEKSLRGEPKIKQEVWVSR